MLSQSARAGPASTFPNCTQGLACPALKKHYKACCIPTIRISLDSKSRRPRNQASTNALSIDEGRSAYTDALCQLKASTHFLDSKDAPALEKHDKPGHFNEGCNMPERQVLRRAERDKQEGKSASTQAGEFVREEMWHIREGKHGARSPQQAIAIGLSKARRAGVNLPPPKKGRFHLKLARKPNAIPAKVVAHSVASPRLYARAPALTFSAAKAAPRPPNAIFPGTRAALRASTVRGFAARLPEGPPAAENVPSTVARCVGRPVGGRTSEPFL